MFSKKRHKRLNNGMILRHFRYFNTLKEVATFCLVFKERLCRSARLLVNVRSKIKAKANISFLIVAQQGLKSQSIL
jgi:hypothetical protein